MDLQRHRRRVGAPRPFFHRWRARAAGPKQRRPRRHQSSNGEGEGTGRRHWNGEGRTAGGRRGWRGDARRRCPCRVRPCGPREATSERPGGA
ncbi:hypothetical protein PAHAL_2G249500 [Panicum hallii]|uniref:Uncharacterized protein n=1 Tax=Panicum hallii TaxID=206008 RepID=A0A2T8KQF9_9POAL|nr:hypothetical protein PAHAL_2G249500 [Panicum hallii]